MAIRFGTFVFVCEEDLIAMPTLLISIGVRQLGRAIITAGPLDELWQAECP